MLKKSQTRALDALETVCAIVLGVPGALRAIDTLEGLAGNIESIDSSQRKLSECNALDLLETRYMIPVVNTNIIEKSSPISELEPSSLDLASHDGVHCFTTRETSSGKRRDLFLAHIESGVLAVVISAADVITAGPDPVPFE